jgi:hypothetical protein
VFESNFAEAVANLEAVLVKRAVDVVEVEEHLGFFGSSQIVILAVVEIEGSVPHNGEDPVLEATQKDLVDE